MKVPYGKYVIPQWLYDSLAESGEEDMSSLIPVPSWVYDKNDVSAEAMTMRLHDRWAGRSFIKMATS